MWSMDSQLEVREEANMTAIDSLDSVLQASTNAALQQHTRTVEGEKLADARADVLSGIVGDQAHMLQPKVDRFSADPADTDDARLNRALRALAEKFQAGRAARTAPAEAGDAQQVAVAASIVGAASGAAPVTAAPVAPSPAPAVTAPADTSSSSGSGTGTSSGNNGNGKGSGNSTP